MSDKVRRAVCALLLILAFILLNNGCAGYPVTITPAIIHVPQGSHIPEVTDNEFKLPQKR
jgi:hypothetical protein